jgi:acyl-CoA dehydrogenase
MPKEVGGAGLGISAAAMVMRTIGKLGSAAVSSVHLNLFGPQPVVVFGTEAQKRRMLAPLIDGTDRACFGVTEPNVGSDTTRVRTFARREGDRYIVHGQKVWTSTAQHANKILLVTRTTPIEECARPMDGVTLFYTDLDSSHVRISEIEKMARKAVDSTSLFIDGLEIPVDDRIGEEGQGFRYLLHGLNPERILVAASALGGAETALKRATDYAKERVVFGRPIGKNQAIQHPLAECWMRLQSAELLMWKAASLYDAGKPCGVEATAAKYTGGGGRLRHRFAAHARRLRLRQGVPRRARPARKRAIAARAGDAGAGALLRGRAGARTSEVVLTGARQPPDPSMTIYQPRSQET